MGIDSIVENIKTKLIPTKKERQETENAVNTILDVTRDIIKSKGLSYTLSGSIIRDTWLPQKKDFDLFIMFPDKTPREQLEKDGIAIGKAITRKLKGKYKIAYAEHPYTRAEIMGFDVDIVPCYKLKSADKIKSAVDRTPFHNIWIKKNLPPELSNEVRVLKQFAKSMNIYGSDTKVQGMSGYLCEILIIKYGSFKKLISSISSWKPRKVIIDIEKYHNKLPDALKKKFKDDALIVIDPVDKNRNVASALSVENFEKLVNCSKLFLNKPSPKFFSEIRTINVRKLESSIKKRKSFFIAVRFKSPDVIDDILFPQLRRASKRITMLLKKEEFEVLGNDVYADKMSILLFELRTLELPSIRKIEGPPAKIKDKSKEFLSKYKKIWIEKGRWYAETKREFRKPQKLLRQFLTASEKTLRNSGIPSHISKSLNKGFSVINENQIIKMSKKNKGFALFLSEYMKKVSH